MTNSTNNLVNLINTLVAANGSATVTCTRIADKSLYTFVVDKEINMEAHTDGARLFTFTADRKPVSFYPESLVSAK